MARLSAPRLVPFPRILPLVAALFFLSGMIAFSSPARAAQHSSRGHPLPQIRGFSIQLSDPNGLQGYLKAIDDLANMGCTWVNFVVAARQHDVHSEAISINWRNIPTEKDITRILRHAKTRGMNVMLMPIVLLDEAGTKEWRGVIAPADWDRWFASYTFYITFMAKLARSCDVDIFCVGSELLSTEPFRNRWVDIISTVRGIFPGKLTYSANWDHYDPAHGGPTFWDQLDYIGMNNYNELADGPGASVQQLDEAWKPIKKDILDFVAKEKKPFFFTEVGWHNLENTIREPWNYVADGPIDPKEQLHAYESFVQTWGNEPRSKFMGAFIWEWRPGADGSKDHGSYSLQNTEALKVVDHWMAVK